MDKLIAAYSPDPANDHLGDIPFFLIHTTVFHYVPKPYLKLKTQPTQPLIYQSFHQQLPHKSSTDAITEPNHITTPIIYYPFIHIIGCSTSMRYIAPPPATSADLAKEVIVRRHRGGEPTTIAALDEPQESLLSNKEKDRESSPHLPTVPPPVFLPPTTPPPPPPYTTIPPPPASPAAATTTSGTIIDAEFPAGG